MQPRTLLSLPPELFPSILAHLTPHSLSSLSFLARTSRLLYALAAPVLWEHFTLRYSIAVPGQDEDEAPTEEQQERERERIRAALEELAYYEGPGDEEEDGGHAGDTKSAPQEQDTPTTLFTAPSSRAARARERCAWVRTLELWNYQYWLSEAEAGWLEKCVGRMGGLREARLMQHDDGAPFDPLLTPLPLFPPIWAALRTLPHVRTLRTQYGPNVVLALQDGFPALEELRMGMYFVDAEQDGVIPCGVRRLRLEYVTGFEWLPLLGERGEWWFPPRVFAHLERLCLVDLPGEAVEYIAQMVETYATSSPPSSSPLTHLTLDLHTTPSIPLPSTQPGPLAQLLSAFSLLQSVTHLAVASTPPLDSDGARGVEPHALLAQVAAGYGATLRSLSVLFGPGNATTGKKGNYVQLNAGEDAAGEWDGARRAVRGMRELERFETNLLPLALLPPRDPLVLRSMLLPQTSSAPSPNDPPPSAYAPLSFWAVKREREVRAVVEEGWAAELMGRERGGEEGSGRGEERKGRKVQVRIRGKEGGVKGELL
ncbi:hypothetical protein JCM6882_004349 [Rhodosporidiobolus microsporus]